MSERSERTVGVRETVRRMVKEETDSLRTDVDNLERLTASMIERQSDTSYETRRVKEITESIRKHLEKLEEGHDKMVDNLSDLRLIRMIVYGGAGMILTAFMAWLLVRQGGGLPRP